MFSIISYEGNETYFIICNVSVSLGFLKKSPTAPCKKPSESNLIIVEIILHCYNPSTLSTMSKSPSLRRIQADIRELALDPSE